MGTASGTATVKLTVEAEIELSGTVPGINSLTEVTAQVGSASFKANADDAGAYKITIKSSKPTAFVTLTAKESGARAALTRTSQLGDFSSLFAQSGQRVSATQWPALTLDALSTARHGLLQQRGQQPTTSSELTRALAAQDPTDLVDVVTLLRHVYEDGVALPAGVATATELASSSAALAKMDKNWVGGGVVQNISVEKSLALMAAATPPAVAAQGSRIATMIQGNYGNTPAGSLFELRADGSATGIVWTFSTNTATNASWTSSGNTLTIQLAAPVLMDGTYRAIAQQLRQLRGVDTQPSRQLMSRWLIDCPASPGTFCATPTYTDWVPVVGYDVDRDRQALRLEDFVAGTTWAGVNLAPNAGIASCMCQPRTFAMDGTPNVPGFQGMLVDGRWVLTASWATFRHTRLGAGPEPGMEYWLTELLENGVTTRATMGLVAKAAAVPALDMASAAHQWLATFQSANGSADVTGARYGSYDPAILHKDGRFTYQRGNGELDRGDRWSLSADGLSITQIRASDGARFLLYAPLRTVSGGYLAMTEGGSLLRMRDMGPAD